jgi:hypothetical protein
MKPTIIDTIPGMGNLDARMLWAAVVGPMRVCHGTDKTLNLAANTPVQVASNPAPSDRVMFVGVSLPIGAAGPAPLVFSRTSDVLGAANVPAVLEPRIGAPAGISFQAVLAPGEELYVQSSTAVRIVAFQVRF